MGAAPYQPRGFELPSDTPSRRCSCRSRTILTARALTPVGYFLGMIGILAQRSGINRDGSRVPRMRLRVCGSICPDTPSATSSTGQRDVAGSSPASTSDEAPCPSWGKLSERVPQTPADVPIAGGRWCWSNAASPAPRGCVVSHVRRGQRSGPSPGAGDDPTEPGDARGRRLGSAGGCEWVRSTREHATGCVGGAGPGRPTMRPGRSAEWECSLPKVADCPVASPSPLPPVPPPGREPCVTASESPWTSSERRR